MPNLWTHFVFGQAVLEQVKPGIWTGNARQLNIFNLGCQGPDLLFYHNQWPWTKDKSVQHLGNLMHVEHCGHVLMSMADRAAGRSLYDPALIYAAGFILHHVLDRAMHPFVFYYSGFKKWDHQRFEVIMDAIVVKKRWDRETWREPALPHIDLGPRLPEEVAELLTYVAHKWYPESAGNVTKHTFQTAYRDMRILQRLFHDPNGWKRRVTLNKIEAMVPRRDNAPHDYMNEARRPWIHPAVPSETYTFSAWDLWDQAFADALHVTEACFRYWELAPGPERQEAREQLRRLIGNVAYDTGKPCEWKLEITLADPIWNRPE